MASCTISCYPIAVSTVLQNPSKFYAQDLRSSPFPTHSFFQNFVIGNGDQPVFLHPYMVKLLSSGICFCYPSVSTSSSTISQNFADDFSICFSEPSSHLVSSFSDLTVTVDFEAGMRLFLARGSPYITLEVSRPLCLTFSCKSNIKNISSSSSNTKHKIELENNQCMIIYSNAELTLKKQENTKLYSRLFVGMIRVAIMPNNKPKTEEILDLYKTCYPVSSDVLFSNPFSLEYKWQSKGWGELLMLAHPLHLKLLTSVYSSEIKVLNNFKYESIDGDLVAVVGNLWRLRSPYVPVTWYSLKGIPETSHPEIVTSLWRDVAELDSSAVSTTHIFDYSYMIFRAARLALIAEEVTCRDVIPAIRKFLRDTINPWLNNKFEGNGFVYEMIWGGILTKQSIVNKYAEHGFGFFKHAHFLGYFVYAIAVLAKIDSDWGQKFRNEAYTLVGSWMNMGQNEDSKYARFRHFDFYKLHSWTGPASEDCNSHHSSEPVLTFYAAALLGKVYGDDHLSCVASTLASFEIEATKTWFHVKEGGVYGEKFTKGNKFVGKSTMSKRVDSLYFASAEEKEVRVGMHVLPLLPITEVVFSGVAFVRKAVEWATPALSRKGVDEGRAGSVHALEALYDKEGAIKKIKNLKVFNRGNSLTNYLWWAHSRDERENLCSCCMIDSAECWYCACCG